MAKPYGRVPRTFSKSPAPKKTPPKIVVKIEGEMEPGELAITMQRAADELDALGMRVASKVSIYITPLEPNQQITAEHPGPWREVWIKGEDGKPKEELKIQAYQFVDRTLKI